jgi:SAM-dependent methyltransferase
MDIPLFKSLARDWEAHGSVDPFFGVLSDPSKRGGKWDAEAFFESGRQHVRNLMASLRDAGVDVPGGTCLDFGCGVGRLTQPFCEFFESVTGVDVAKSMVRSARHYNAYGSRCRFLVNASPDLRQFPDHSFDLVHSCIVLQHLPPEMALGYIAEFLRVARPGGVVVFQVPDSLRPADQSAGAFAMPPAAYRASIELAGPLPALRAGELVEIAARVTNAGPVEWRTDAPTKDAGHIRLANHWLAEDGSMAIRDDGRGYLTKHVGPGETVDVPMVVRPPAQPGSYILELDLVQELVTWFADKGSPTFRVPVQVEAGGAAARAAANPPRRPAVPPETGRAPIPKRTEGLFARLFGHRSSPAKSTFPMHVIPRAQVEQAVATRGWRIARVFEDEACGPGWVSYTYVATGREDVRT